MVKIEHDIVINGGGVVGLCLAHRLARHSLKVLVLERNALELSLQPHRVSAINQASQQLLDSIGVWTQIAETDKPAYNTMQVWEAQGAHELTFRAEECQRAQLGWIVNHSALIQTLHDTLPQSVSYRGGVSPSAVKSCEAGLVLTLSDQTAVPTSLLIGADGLRSWVRQAADIALEERRYRHTAMVATVKTTEPHQQTAWQIFNQQGILALLPLADPHQASIVWSVDDDYAQQLSSLEQKAFEHELSYAFEQRFGAIQLGSERVSFPLSARIAKRFYSDRMALVGDAAHTIHPLAGHGLNLGLADVVTLDQSIHLAMQRGMPLAHPQVMSRYERRAQYEAKKWLVMMRFMRHGFTWQAPAIKIIRGMATAAINHSTALKKHIVSMAQ